MSEETSVTTESGPTLGERVMAFAGHGDAKHITADIPDAAASEDEAEGADLQGNPGEDADESNGLDTDAEEAGEGADPDEDEEADADETDQKEHEEPEQKGTRKKTLEERAAEIAEKIVNEKLAQRDQQNKVETPDFAGPEVVADVKRNIVKKMARIRELESAIELEGDEADPKAVDELLSLHDFVADAKAALKENENRKVEWEKRQGQKQAQDQSTVEVRKELDRAAELYRAEMKIDQATWDKMGAWFESQVTARPLMVEEFNDILAKQGKVAAIRFAHEYTVKHMGQETKKANEKKEVTKTKAAALAPTTTGKVANVDLQKARKAYEENPSPDTFAALKALQRQAKGA